MSIEGGDGIGGAIYIIAGDPVIKGCRFKNNRASGRMYAKGGAIFNLTGGPEISDCIFEGNRADAYMVGSGGAIYSSEPKVFTTITNCRFDGNSASSRGTSSAGGAIVNNGGAVIISDCRFSNNTVESIDAAGGTIEYSSATVDIRNTIFFANRIICPVTNFDIDRPIVGGAIFNSDNTASITNCTFFANEAILPSTANKDYAKGGAIANYKGKTTITNSILWGNTAGTNNEIYDDAEAKTTVTYSNIDQRIEGGISNINLDPRFGTDLHLQFDSPCREKADQNTVPKTDIDGEIRPTETLPDMGADQFIDSDGDLMPDYWEKVHKVESSESDKDGDMLSNLKEYHLGTDPNQVQRSTDTVLRGAVRDDGLHQVSDSSTPTGNKSPNDGPYRSFFVFKVSNAKPVKNAILRLELVKFENELSFEIIQIHEVSSETTALSVDMNGQPGIDIYNDLGSGVQYGKYSTEADDVGSALLIPLNRAAVKAINVAIADSKDFIIGLSLKDRSWRQFLSFSTADEKRIHQLVLEEK